MSNDKPKRNVEDVAYVAADLSETPMREVLRDRKSLVATIPRALREAAYRERAGIIGVLQSCLCAMPLRRAETDSGHADWCPSTALLASQREASKRSLSPMMYAASNEHDTAGTDTADRTPSDAVPEESEAPRD